MTPHRCRTLTPPRTRALLPSGCWALAGLLIVSAILIGCSRSSQLAPKLPPELAAVAADALTHDGYRVPWNEPLPSEVAAYAAWSNAGAASEERSSPFQLASSRQPVSDLASGPRPVSAATAGQLPLHFQDVSRDQVLAIAFANSQVIRDLGGRVLQSPESVPTAYDYAIQQADPFYGPQAALAQFDTQLNGSVLAANNDRVFNNAVLGGGAQELVQDAVTVGAGISRRLPGGAVVSLNQQTAYDSNNRSANLFPSIWETHTEVGIRQPLLRGAGRTFNAIAGPNAQPGFYFSNGFVIAQMNSRQSALQFERALTNYLSEVEDAYWLLQLAYRQYEGRLTARNHAEQVWRMVDAKQRQGLVGGEADKAAEAKSEFLSYHLQAMESLSGTARQIGVLDSERRLRYLIGYTQPDGYLLRPSETASVAPMIFDWQCQLNVALAGRVELREQALRIHKEELQLLAAKNFLLPQLDLISRYRLRGFGDDLTGSGPRFASAMQDYSSMDHQEWEFGVEMQMAAGRRQALAAVQHAKLKVSRQRELWDQQKQAVAHELAEAMARVETLRYAVQIAADQTAAAQQRLVASQAQYQAGATTVHLLLDAQQSAIQSQLRHIELTTDYAIAIKNVSLASGQLLTPHSGLPPSFALSVAGR